MTDLLLKMPPVELRADVIFFIEKEFGWNKGKNIQFKSGKTNGSGTVTGTCPNCNNFQIVFKSTAESDGFTFRPELSSLKHVNIRDDESTAPCPCTIHNASQVNWYCVVVRYYSTLL